VTNRRTDRQSMTKNNRLLARRGDQKLTRVLPDLTISLMKLTASTMLSAAVKTQYSSVLPLLRHFLLVFE